MALDRDNDEGAFWLRSGTSFREGFSRGSQTTTDDFEEEFQRGESHPATPATNVRRASFLLGDLRTIYSPPQTASGAANPKRQHVQPEVRCPPSSSNPWNIHWKWKVLPELEGACRLREDWRAKCNTFREEVGTRTVARCFLCWRKGNMRYLAKHLASAVEKNSTDFYKQRRVSLVKVWSHISIGLSEKEVVQRGSRELASESIAQRLLRKHKRTRSSTITTGTIDEEIDHIAGVSMDDWFKCYLPRKYLRRWRESRHLPTKYFKERRSRTVLFCWRLQLANKEIVDYSRYDEAKSFHAEKMTRAAMRHWRERSEYAASRRRILCSAFLRTAQAIDANQKANKRKAFRRWTEAVETDRVYRARPFRRWRDLNLDRRYRERIQGRVVAAYLRARGRRRLWSAYRAWRHQARYGRVAARHTRSELAAGWTEQKRRCERLAAELRDGKAEDVRRLEERLRRSEAARASAERELSEMRSANTASSAFSGTNTFRESLAALYPMLLHSENVL